MHTSCEEASSGARFARSRKSAAVTSEYRRSWSSFRFAPDFHSKRIVWFRRRDATISSGTTTCPLEFRKRSSIHLSEYYRPRKLRGRPAAPLHMPTNKFINERLSFEGTGLGAIQSLHSRIVVVLKIRIDSS